jgi:hypothetical protein
MKRTTSTPSSTKRQPRQLVKHRGNRSKEQIYGQQPISPWWTAASSNCAQRAFQPLPATAGFASSPRWESARSASGAVPSPGRYCSPGLFEHPHQWCIAAGVCVLYDAVNESPERASRKRPTARLCSAVCTSTTALAGRENLARPPQGPAHQPGSLRASL